MLQNCQNFGMLSGWMFFFWDTATATINEALKMTKRSVDQKFSLVIILNVKISFLTFFLLLFSF